MNKFYKARTSVSISFVSRIAACLAILLVPFLLYSIGTFENPWFFIPFIFVPLIILTVYEGIILDFENQRLKTYVNILGWALGQWQSMPAYCRITAVRTAGKRKISSNRATPEYEYLKISYEIRLYDIQSHDYQIASKGTKRKVQADAERLSHLIQIPIEDFTETH